MANEAELADHQRTIQRRIAPRPDVALTGLKPTDDLMALYGPDGRLVSVFDSTREVDLIVPDAPDDQPVTEADLANARVENFDFNETGTTYFIGGEVGAIKIGRSINVEVRLKDIQACSPIPIRVLATRAGTGREAMYHRLFAAHRLYGEWFDRHPDILAEIERLNSLPPSFPGTGEAVCGVGRT